MKSILIISLGNIPEPVINCINKLRPDRTVFVCSEESREFISEVQMKARMGDFDPERDVHLLQQRAQGKKDHIRRNGVDQLDRVYCQARDLIQQLRAQEPGCKITLDYTGGTKSMAAGLAMAAVDDGEVQLSVTTHNREPKKTSISGYSVPRNVNVLITKELLRYCRNLLNLALLRSTCYPSSA